MIEKERSARNKTIAILPNEIELLSSKLSTPGNQNDINNPLGKIFNADMMDIVDHLPKYFVDLLILDPPYNLNKDFGDVKFKATSDGSYIEYLETWFPKLLRTLKPNASIYMCGDWKCTNAMFVIMEKYTNIRNRITWQREKGRGALKNWKNCTEDIWFGTLSDDYYFDIDAVKQRRKVIAPYKVDGKPKDWEESEDGNFRLTCPSNFWDDLTVPYWSMSENTDHPTQKPEKLIAKLILASCPENGVVFDPFLGSGTTCVVAKKLKRNFVGIEKNTEYCLVSQKRLISANTNNSIQGYSDGVFWERNTLQEQIQTTKKTKAITRETSLELFGGVL